MSDTPNVDLVLTDLEKEVVRPEDFVVVLSKNKRITFKDLYGFKVSERHEFRELMERRDEVDDIDLLKRCLSPEDLKKYVDEDVNIRIHQALMQKVMAHYQQGLGTPGEGAGSVR